MYLKAHAVLENMHIELESLVSYFAEYTGVSCMSKKRLNCFA